MTAPFRMPVEARFPLDLSVSIPPIYQLYEDAKLDIWAPQKDVPWESFDRAAFTEEVLAAARQVWSRRAWLEYTGIAETPALLLRFCMERRREADPKYFLTVRNTEEAELVETYHHYAEMLGGYIDRPAASAWEDLFNRNYYRDALNAEVSLDAYCAVHCALEDDLEVALYRAYLANAREPLAHAVLEKSLQDKQRHAEFGWQYLAARAKEFTAGDAAAVIAAVKTWLGEVELAGYHVPSLSTCIDSRIERESQTLAANAGLGAVPAQQEEGIFRAWLSAARDRLGKMNIHLAALSHPRLGQL